MKRRDLLTLLGAALASPLAAHAQQKPMPVIGLLGSSSPGAVLPGFRKGLAETGFVEGDNVAIEFRWAEGHYDRLPAMAADLVRQRVAVITAMASPAARAAKAATATIPIVFYSGIDPVEAGLVDSLAHPGGNLTGLSAFVGRLNQKRVELLHDLLPGATTFALLLNPSVPSAAVFLKRTEQAMRALGIPMIIAHASSDEELATAFASLSGKVGGRVLGPDPFFGTRHPQIAALAAQYRLPTIFNDRRFVDAGGLISYGENGVDLFRQVGVYTGKVLKGAKPADLPVQQPTTFELVINLKTAKALGLSVPQAILARADEVIE